MCDTMKEGYSFYYISTTGIYTFCHPVAGDWLGYIWGIMNKPTGYKKGADAVAPLSAHEA